MEELAFTQTDIQSIAQFTLASLPHWTLRHLPTTYGRVQSQTECPTTKRSLQVSTALLGTLSTENGNRNGDAETAGRLGRERGFGALLKAVKQHRENADCKKPLYICTGVLVAVMSSLRAVRNQLLISHNEGVISDEEFLLLYDLNKSKNLDFPYDSYDCFDFDD